MTWYKISEEQKFRNSSTFDCETTEINDSILFCSPQSAYVLGFDANKHDI